ncbi:MAG: hydroxymethylbilane synthase [Patescibacteria group bacterium]|nr:hydroxymethylbilane synthase [Patescibacteria group bacterium]MDE2588920.1 hydroxymethylbilane synthase [Patescibacteria group bacterium]
MGKRIVIGTRGSKLSLAQTNLVKNMLQPLLPDTTIEIQIIHTEGDRNMSPVPLDTVGKGWFTKELDNALLKKKVDLTVHSLKDIPEELPSGLIIAAIPRREDAREALVSANGKRFDQLKKGAVVGTDSTRRKAQILNLRPDLIVKSLRGNVNTRLEKLDNGAFDGIFLAVAGLKRLGLVNRITQYFDEKKFIPSPGQGALAIVIRKDDAKLRNTLKKLNDANTASAVKAERQFSKFVGGGCKMPVGAYAKVTGKKMVMYGVIGSLDGKHVENQTVHGTISNSQTLSKLLAKKLLKKCKPWYTNAVGKYIITTRPNEQKDEFAKKLQQIGHKVFTFSTITISKSKLSARAKSYLFDLDSFDWVIFTSKHGITHLIKTLKELHIDPKLLQTKNIAVVGPQTAETAKKHDLPITFMPTKFTSDDLAIQLTNVKRKKILLARSTIATSTLTQKLKDKGATIINIPIYKTTFTKNSFQELKKLIGNNMILCITFTSPSTIDGFIKNIPPLFKKDILTIPVLSIGPVTTKEAKRIGFKNIYTAKTHTTDGMITVLKQNIL